MHISEQSQVFKMQLYLLRKFGSRIRMRQKKAHWSINSEGMGLIEST